MKWFRHLGSRRLGRAVKKRGGELRVGRRRPRGERLEARKLLAVDIVFDYSYDDAGFFTSDAKAAIERAADDFEARLQDTLTAIPTPPANNSWAAAFQDPETGTLVSISNLELAENEVRVFVGSRDLSGNTRGRASTAYSLSYTLQSWADTILYRGQTGENESSTWGGSIAFDTSPVWHLGADEPSSGETDMYSIALHELAHLFGITNLEGNTWTEYTKSLEELSAADQTLVGNEPGDYFTGPKSVALYGSPISVSGGHFSSGVSYQGQEVALDPTLTTGTRKRMTALDWAALDDIGWDVAAEVSTTQDILAVNDSGQWYAADSVDGAAFLRQIGGWADGIAWTDVTIADFNGDGVDDVIARNSASNAWVVGERGASGLSFRTAGIWSTSVTWTDITIADFSGDGKADIAARGAAGTWVVGVSNGTAIATASFGGWNDTLEWKDVMAADINGDGRSDIIGRTSGSWIVAESQGSSFTNRTLGSWANSVDWTNVMVGDFDGDGNDDIYGRGAGGRWVVAISAGTAINTRTVGGWSEAITWRDIQTADLNGDGKAELMARNAADVWIASFYDSGLFRTVTLGAWGSSDPLTLLATLDLNGDGKSELVGAAADGRLVRSELDGDEQLVNADWGSWPAAVDLLFTGSGNGL